MLKSALKVLFLSILLSLLSCVGESQQTTISANNAVSDAPPPKPANAWSPGEGFYKDYPTAWRKRLQGEVERAKEGGINLLFLGDSLTQDWAKGGTIDTWNKDYKPLGAVNFGIGGDGTPQLLYRIDHGILEGLAPKVVVLNIGINNTWPGYSAEDTVKGIAVCLKSIENKLPHTRILLLGLFPAFGKDDPIRQRIRTINDSIAHLADGQRVRFLDIGPRLLEADGSLKKGCYVSDRLHLQTHGYQVWAEAMDPLLKEMMSLPSYKSTGNTNGPAVPR